MKEKDIINLSKTSSNEILLKHNTTINGYSNELANSLLDKFGLNIIKNKKEKTKLKLLFEAFNNYFNALLLVVGIVSFFTDVIFSDNPSYLTPIVLLIIILLSGIIQFIQELRSQISLNKLKDMVINTTAVIRSGIEQEIDIKNIVVGDIIKLSAGDIIPADLRILESKDLFLSESTFTGESNPVEKFDKGNNSNNILELNNICYLGTDVISGTGIGIVIATGSDTYLSKITESIEENIVETSFDKGVKAVSKLLIKMTLVMVSLVFIINLIGKGNPLLAFIFALTVAVGTTPELLPMIINSNLSKGMINLSKKKVIVKNLNSIQNLGAIDVLCTDKTGTITEDKIILDEYLDVYGNKDQSILKYAYLNSYYQTGLKNNGHVVGYMGDGINDAPALKEADVGISVDTGVEIAKETANIVLLEKNLLVLEEGIVEGRKVFTNIMKYLNMSISSNVGNMISFIIASIFIPFLPILPVQILIQNLLYDISQIGISFDNVDQSYTKKPKKWDISNIFRFTVWFGPVSSIFDFLIFYILWYVIGVNTIGTQAIFQSGWFVMGIVSQTIIIFVIRTKQIPFFKSKPSLLLLSLSILISIIGIMLPYLRVGTYFGLVQLPMVYICLFVLVMILYMLFSEFIKYVYIKFYDEWI